MEVPRSSLPITNEEVKNFCLRYFHKTSPENLRVIRYEVTGMAEATKGYKCYNARHQYLNALVQLKTESDTRENKACFLIKSAPQDVASQMEYLEEFGVFKKETFVYKYVIPRLQDINIGRGYFAPKCYLTKTNLLIFENLSEQGFRLGSKQDGILDFDHLICALRSLANMHAASLVLEIRAKKTIPEMYKVAIEEHAYPSDPLNIRNLFFKDAVAVLSSLVKKIPEYETSPELPRILLSLPQIFGKIFEFCKPSRRWKNVFCHGDLWANNILFRYGSVASSGNSCPVECRMVDYQFARYAPPVMDVVTLLTIPNCSSFRKQHLTTLLDTYYRLLGEYLAQHDINVEEVIPKSEFHSSAEHYELAGLIESCVFSHLAILPPAFYANLFRNSDKFDEFLTKHKSELCLKVFESDQVYRARLSDMLCCIVDSYILGKNSLITKV